MNEYQISSEIIRKIAEEFHCPEGKLLIGPQLSGGRSGDQVYLITVSDPPNLERAGEYILKIQKKSNKDEFDKEVNNTYSARNACSTDKIRVPTVRCFSVVSGYYVYDVAGVGAKETATLLTQLPEKKLSRFKDFVDASVFAWSSSFSATSASLSEIIECWLGEKRLAPGSRLAERLRKFIHDELSEAWRVNNLILPNPYYYFTCTTSEEKNPILNNVLQGPQHGDLNQTNILIQPLDKGYLYYLIDFSHYHSQSFLLFDQAYLLLDILLGIDGLLLTDWISRLQEFFLTLGNRSKLPKAFDTFGKYANSFMDGWSRFLARYPQNGKVLTIQLLCACAAAGLNFLHKSMASESKQIFSLAFSSLALRELMNLEVCVPPDEAGEYPELYTGTTGKIPEIWNITDGFSQNSRYILISSCLPEHIHQDSFCTLEPIPWTAIIEVNHLLENDLRNKALQKFRRRQGYRHILLSKNQEILSPNKEATWCSVVVDKETKNKSIFYSRHIRTRLNACMESVLAQQEKYPLCILVDSRNLDMSIGNEILTDLLVTAGENTMIDVINLSDCELLVDEEAYIRVHQIPCELANISRNIQMSFNRYDNYDIQIPTPNSFVSLDSSITSDLENDLQIIHRRLINIADDDQGEAFYHGGEPSWHDIAYQRDVERIDYKNTWHDQISRKLERLQSSGSDLIWLYHRPGGGGTTMAKRIMWDFCSQYPTIYLKKISDRTTERLKMLYKASGNMPILIVTELNDSAISSISLSSLRMELIRRNVRALFICVSRKNERGEEYDSSNFYLPDTPQMYLTVASEDVCSMHRKFSACLDPEQDQERLGDLNDLTYVEGVYSDELRQPFFYGLFAFGNEYKKIEEYVHQNLLQVNEQEILTLEILAFNTVYSQTINLNLQEIAYILFPNQTLDRNIFDQTRAVLSKNCFVVHRDSGYRISHPLIARKLLDELLGSNRIHLAKQLVDILGRFYNFNSSHLDDILHELFIYRKPLTETQRKVFSDFITELPYDKQRIEIMDYLREKFPRNPHYSNHLARLYLKPQDEDQWPDIVNAKKYAQEAIDRAENLSGEGSSIHHHLMGKVYARECISQLKYTLHRSHISSALKTISPIYHSALREFNICSHGKNAAYGLVGRLELITKVLNTIHNELKTTIPHLLVKEQSIYGTLTEMIAEAGNIIQQYKTNLDDSDMAFQKARLDFYKLMENISNIESVFYTNEASFRLRANSRRSVVTILESRVQGSETVFSYNLLDTDTLTKIKSLMEENIYTDAVGINSDRFRWLEAYRRLDEFDLSSAYQFVQDWPDGSENLDIVYYRFVLSFLFYAKYQGITYQTVRQHLNQCQQLAQKAYGKYTTRSRDLLGYLTNNDRAVLVPWQVYDSSLDQAEREQKNRDYRKEHCDFIIGSVSSIKEGMVDFRFSIEKTGNTVFIAQAPRIDETINLLDGQQVRFHLGFSYSGFRAWDIEKIE